jgi:hypothetical protein
MTRKDEQRQWGRARREQGAMENDASRQDGADKGEMRRMSGYSFYSRMVLEITARVLLRMKMIGNSSSCTDTLSVWCSVCNNLP